MLIDWFTVAAQIVNFLILVWLLKRFLFGRLVAAMDQREKRIAGRLAEAEEKRQEATRQVETAQAKALEMERQRDELLEHARQEAAQQRDELLRKTREAVSALDAKWRDDLKRERAVFLDQMKRRSAEEILTMLRRALGDLACCDVQHCATEVLLEKLRTFDAASLRELVSHELTVLSPGPLDAETELRIRKTLESRLGAPVAVRFDTAPAMAWGLELRGNGRRLGWNSGTYLEALEENLKEALERRAEPVAR